MAPPPSHDASKSEHERDSNGSFSGSQVHHRKISLFSPQSLPSTLPLIAYARGKRNTIYSAAAQKIRSAVQTSVVVVFVLSSHGLLGNSIDIKLTKA